MSLFTTSPIFNFGKKGEFNNSKVLSDWAKEVKDSITSVYGLLSDKSTRKSLLKQLLFGNEEQRNIKIPKLLDATEVSKNLTALKQSSLSLVDFMEQEGIDTTSAMGQAFLKASEDVDIMNLSVDKLMDTNKQYVKEQTRISKSFSAQGLFGLGKSALKTLGGAFLNVGASLAIEAGISAAATAIYNWVHAAEIAIEKGQEARNTISEVYSAMNERKTSINQLATEATGETYETSTESVEALAKKYAELAKGVNSRTNENVSLSTDDYELYLSISNQLAGVLPGLVSGLDSIFDNPIHRTA